jgi:putative redox protein
MATISAYLDTGLRVKVSSGRHNWYADEPIDFGGTDEGPSPYQLLLGSLAACTAITLRLYAQHKGFELGSVRLEYTYERDTTLDDELERITATITIGGEFTDAQRTRLAQIAARCPVHRTLARGVAIVDDVRFESSE